VFGHLVLHEPENARRRAHGLRDPEKVEVLLVPRIVHARDGLADAVRVLRDLRDDEVVLVVPGHREEQLRRTRDPCALEDGDLGRVSAEHDRPELLLEPREAVGPLLDHRDLVPEIEKRARDVRSDLPSPGNDRVHQAEAAFGVAMRTVSSRDEIAVCVGQTTLIPRPE